MAFRDTVASVGLLVPQTLPFVSNDTIRTFRHAVSLDEHRTKFGVTLWKPETEVTDEALIPNSPKVDTDASVHEMWFSGGHCGKFRSLTWIRLVFSHHPFIDVGGGNVADGTNPDLSNISFRWMLHQIVKSKCGILFDYDGLNILKVPHDCVPRPNIIPPMNSKSSSDVTVIGGDERSEKKGEDVAIPSWEEADRIDAAAEAHDALKANPLWWFLQVPSWTGKRVDFTGQRIFPEDDTRQTRSNIHWTVLERMKSKKGYAPRAYLPGK